jgi:hypothetical protein
MKAKDLRIGNWVESDGFELTVTSVYGVNIDINVCPYTGNHNEEYSLKDIKPIPINKEWLKKLGFNNPDRLFELYDINIGDEETLSISLHGNNPTWSIEWDNVFLKDREIKYIHQLQNLYFALTDNEL